MVRPEAKLLFALRQLATRAPAGWWSSWIKSMADCSKVMSEGPEAFADVLLRMAVFDGCAETNATSPHQT
eukprot:SAG31_NODE_1949_length_6833_cov_4.354024_4_plen_70_part_00